MISSSQSVHEMAPWLPLHQRGNGNTGGWAGAQGTQRTSGGGSGFSPGGQVASVHAVLPQGPSGLQQVRGRKPSRLGNHWLLFLSSNLSLHSETNKLNQKPLSLGNPCFIGTVLSIRISHLRSRCSHCSKVPPMKFYILLSKLPVTGPTLWLTSQTQKEVLPMWTGK